MSRKTIIVLIALGILGVASVCGWRYGRPAFTHYRENKALAQARELFDKEQYGQASLSVRRALQLNPRNVEALLLFARMAELHKAPQELDLRRRVIEVQPTPQNKLSLAEAALRLQIAPYPIASEVLDELGATETNSAPYHSLRARYYLLLGRPADAALHLLEAIRSDPTNEVHQLNAAVLKLHTTNQVENAQAQTTLERLSSSPETGLVAMRSLAAYHMVRTNWAQAERLSAEILRNKNATIDDRLQHLAILKRSGNGTLLSSLTEFQTQHATNAAAVYLTLRWMAAEDLAAEGLAWFTGLPAALAGEQPAPLGAVQCYITARNWAGLEEYLQGSKWGELEYLRYAQLSRAAWEQKQSLGADTRWRSAVRETGDRYGALMSLLQLASAWGPPENKEALLWHIVQKFPREVWVYKELERRYVSRSDTVGLNKLYTAAISYDSENDSLKNNLASIGLLLRTNLPKAHELARDIYSRNPANAEMASTYALSLCVQGRPEDARQLLEKLSAAELEKPAVALYYGIALAEVGEKTKAQKYFSLVKAEKLLPEERQLLSQAGLMLSGH